MHEGPGFTPFADALFTATSAVTVTGLLVKDTASYWTPVGQAFILGMIFVGGLSFMTLAVFMSIAIGQRLALSRQVLGRDSLQIEHLAGLVRLAARIAVVAAGIQLAGFVALLIRFLFVLPPGEAVFHAAFQAVSAFNNAGFVILPESRSLSAYQTDAAALGVTGALIFLGAIGYWVMVDVAASRKFSMLTLNTRLALIFTLAATVGGAIAFLLSENQPSLAELGIPGKILVSLFESTSGRTAGFSTVGWGAGEAGDHTKLLFSSLMLVGGASGSVAGGIRINTVAVVVVAALSTIRGRPAAVSFGREIGQDQVQRAMTIAATAMFIVLLLALSLTFTGVESTFIDRLFESVSAFGTVGLSSGLTETLSTGGRLALIAAMFIGRTSPFTLDILMIQRRKSPLYRYAQERVTIG